MPIIRSISSPSHTSMVYVNSTFVYCKLIGLVQDRTAATWMLIYLEARRSLRPTIIFAVLESLLPFSSSPSLPYFFNSFHIAVSFVLITKFPRRPKHGIFMIHIPIRIFLRLVVLTFRIVLRCFAIGSELRILRTFDHRFQLRSIVWRSICVNKKLQSL